MASVLARIFGNAVPQSQPTMSHEEKRFDDAYGELVEYIANNMGHGWVNNDQDRFAGIAEYVRAENAATSLIAILTDYKTATRFNTWEFYKGMNLGLGLATAERFDALTVSAKHALMVLQNAEHSDHSRIVGFVSQCQRTDVSMSMANELAVKDFMNGYNGRNLPTRQLT